MYLVKNNISKNIVVIRRISKNLPSNTLLILYYALINPYLDYCNIVWARIRNIHTESLNKIAKKQCM